MKLSIMAVALVALLTLAAAAPPVGEEQFRNDMIARMKKADGAATIVPDKEPLVIKVNSNKNDERTINLHRLFGFCGATDTLAADCETAKSEFARIMNVEPPKPTLASLRIIVRDQQYVDYLDRVERESKDKVVTAYRRPIGDDLYAIMASDGAETIAMVGEKALAELKLTQAAAWELAEKHTRAILPPMPDPAKLRQQATAFQDYPYASSLLADLDRWKVLANSVGDDLLMTVVADSFVFVGVMPDGAVLEEFRTSVAQDCAAQERCISSNAYRLRGGQWVVAPVSASAR